MEAMAVFSGSNIFATSSLLRTTNSKTRYSQLRTTQNLSAFSSKSHLFSLSSTSSSYPKTSRTRSSTESGIFLPRLIASLVTLSLSLSAYQFIITVRNSKCFCSFFNLQEQVDQTYIMVKPDGVQRGLVSLVFSLQTLVNGWNKFKILIVVFLLNWFRWVKLFLGLRKRGLS